ncbi:protease inhibitor I9 family protein [Streptomyces gardneri]|uniref:protease inhibitor I9 family protein n=1 Tax=Streptomyces gardneri TaxID=66892 RepID=UPI0033EA005B
MSTRTRLALTSAALTALALTAPTASASATGPEPTPAPFFTAANAVPGKYIVTLDQTVDAAKTAEKLNLKPSFVYEKALNGFAAPLTVLQLEIVRKTPGVTSVEEDAVALTPPQPSAPATAPGARPPPGAWTGSTSGTCPWTTTSPPGATARG